MLVPSRCLLVSVLACLCAATAPAQVPQTPATEPDHPVREKPSLRLKTATTGLYYDEVGRAIAKSFNNYKPSEIPRIEAVSSRGSAENIQTLGENTIAFAIVQSDVAHAAWYGHPRLDKCLAHDQIGGAPASSDFFACLPSQTGCARPSARASVITPLYIEAMHILIRPHLNISGLQDLRGRKVWAGSIGSGERFSAERILSAAGVPFCDPIFDDPETAITRDEALNRLGKMQLDAVFFTGPVPTHALEDKLARYPEIHFFALTYDLVEKLTQDESYTEALIRAEDYGKPEPTLTVGVEALLMTNDSADPKAVRALADFIHNDSQDLRDTLRDILETDKSAEHDLEIADLSTDPARFLRRLALWREFKGKDEIIKKVKKAPGSALPAGGLDLSYDERAALKDYMEREETREVVARLPLLYLPTPDALVPDFYSGDPAIKEYFSHPRTSAWQRETTLVLVLCLGILAAAFTLMRLMRTKLHRVLVRQPDILLAVVSTVVVWALGSYFLYHYEGLVNEDFNPSWKSFGMIFWYVIPIWGRTALTPNGQFVIRAIKGIGVLLVGGFFSPLIRKVLRSDFLGPFIAWLQGRPLMQKDITGHLVIINWDHRGRDIVRHLSATHASNERVIVVVTPGGVDFTSEDCLEEVIGIVGDATTVECLEKARVEFAHSVTILSAWKPSDPNDRRQSVDRDVADTKTIQTLRAIRVLCARQVPFPNVTVTAEIRSSHNLQEAEHAGGEELQAETVCVDSLADEVLVQSALNPGLATLYARLMTTAANSAPSDAEVLRTTVPRELIGKSFGEMLEYFVMQRRGHGPAIIPLGVCRSSHVFVNPTDEMLGRLQERDVLFAIAARQPAASAVKSFPAPSARATSV